MSETQKRVAGYQCMVMVEFNDEGAPFRATVVPQIDPDFLLEVRVGDAAMVDPEWTPFYPGHDDHAVEEDEAEALERFHELAVGTRFDFHEVQWVLQ